MLQIIDLPQDDCGAGPYADIVRQVDPADDAGSVDQKLGGPRDVPAVLARAGMQDSIPADDFGLRIGQKRKRVALLFAESARFGVGIYADRQDADSARAKFIQVLLKAP